jgi:hypothetical protein
MRAPRVGSIFFIQLFSAVFSRLEDTRQYDGCRVDAKYAEGLSNKRTSATCACTGATLNEAGVQQQMMVPTLRVVMQMMTLGVIGTQSVRGGVPTQNVGTIKCAALVTALYPA